MLHECGFGNVRVDALASRCVTASATNATRLRLVSVVVRERATGQGMNAGSIVPLAVFLLAAVLEVAGDAVIRSGMRGAGLALVAVGFVMLGLYGVVVNLLQIDFSRLLGTYIGVFALVSVLVGRFHFQEDVPLSTWTGLGVVLLGSIIIHLGSRG